LGMFDDNLDGSRSEASLFFQMDHSYTSTNDVTTVEDGEFKMIEISYGRLNIQSKIATYDIPSYVIIKKIVKVQ